MYPYEERMRAVKTYIASGYQANQTIRDLGSHLMKPCGAGTGSIGKTGTCTGTSSEHLCTRRGKRQRLWPVITPTNATMPGLPKPWGMWIGNGCVNRCWNPERRRGSLNISKSSYFYQESVLNRPDKYQNLRQEIREALAAVNGCYGYRRLHAVLKGLGRSVSEKAVRRLMNEEHLAVRKISRRHYNSYLGEISPAVPNLINRDFHAEKPNEKWLTDDARHH